MSTYSSVSMLVDGLFHTAFVKWDGYPEGVGWALYKHFGTTDKVSKLLEHGDIRCIDNSDPEFYSDDPCYKMDTRCVSEDYNYFWNGTSWEVGKYDAAPIPFVEALYNRGFDKEGKRI